ncbi:YfzA family protein [Virgibacillus natechei]
MSSTEKSPKTAKRWIITIGIFIIVQLIFIAVDGTFLEPNINDSGNLFARLGRWILGSSLFTEWICPYSYPLFNLWMTLHVIAILGQTVQDIFSKYKQRVQL